MPITKVAGKKNGKQKYRVRVNYTDSLGKAQQIERTAYGLDEAKEIEQELRLKVACFWRGANSIRVDGRVPQS